MMNQADWKALNAYVDGELDAASRADMAGRIATDPGFAATVAEISRLKAGTRAALQPDAVLPAASLRRLDGVLNKRRRFRRMRAVAALSWDCSRSSWIRARVSSSVARTWPSSTRVPSSTRTSRMRPVISAETVAWRRATT